LTAQIEAAKDHVSVGNMDPPTYHRTCGGIHAMRLILDEWIPAIDQKLEG
jgi:hypothetical protein